MKQNSASSHCRINILKKIGKPNKAHRAEQIERKSSVTIVITVKKENHEHHWKTDKGCESTQNVTGKTSSKLFSSHQRQLQKQSGRTHKADNVFRVRLLA